ncbi:tetratricopeptide repeat protein [Thalassospira mesophila]|uniref:Glycosyl transferase family 8 n=1 Tax=Thalassospira mesophila TaxID=1293891 RepID=A0A1Y2KVF6_9PROT|nr:tetratricopeptide repeat protein [Thalassospira mesophila]OSQ35298.1 glycosyl transferase family 8 [Thalassospira mesophila]
MTNISPAQAEAEARTALAANDFAKAETLARALLANGGQLETWRLLVVALRRQGKVNEALEILDMLVQHAPGNLDLRFDLSELLLLTGDFKRGWREYQYRYSLSHTKILDRKVQKPLWDGRVIHGKTLLIHDEQGYGDTFQFLRMVPWAKERSKAKIILQIREEQEAFAKRMPGIDHIVRQGELPPAFDMHCQMMTLPEVTDLTLADLPGPMPYLTADPRRVRKWQKRLKNLPRPLVALVWAGRPTHFNDAERSMSLEKLAPLAMDGVTFLSVQKGDRANDATTPPPGMNLINLSPEISDFEDTAAIFTLIDLLVSVDSSPVHLAGALGLPTWVMLPFVPDWRWLLNRDDSPWYPTAKLFRQPSFGDWPAVVQNMARELAKLRP